MSLSCRCHPAPSLLSSDPMSLSSSGGGVAVTIHPCLRIVGEWEGRERERVSSHRCGCPPAPSLSSGGGVAIVVCLCPCIVVKWEGRERERVLLRHHAVPTHPRRLSMSVCCRQMRGGRGRGHRPRRLVVIVMAVPPHPHRHLVVALPLSFIHVCML